MSFLGLIKQFPAYAKAVIGTFIIISLGLLVYGAISQEAQSGNVSVPSAVNTTIAGLDTTIGTNTGKVVTAVGIVVGLISIVALMKLVPMLTGGKGKDEGML